MTNPYSYETECQQHTAWAEGYQEGQAQAVQWGRLHPDQLIEGALEREPCLDCEIRRLSWECSPKECYRWHRWQGKQEGLAQARQEIVELIQGQIVVEGQKAACAGYDGDWNQGIADGYRRLQTWLEGK